MRFLKNRKRLGAALALLVLIAVLLWAFRGYQQRQQLARVRLLGSQLRAATPEQRRQQFGELRQAMAKLSAAQREQLARERREAFVKEMRKFFQLSRKEQISRLDQQIKRMEQRRREWQQQRPANGGQGRRGGTLRDSDEADQRARNSLDRSTPEERALRSEYRALMDQRRRQLGLPPFGGPGGRGGGWPRG